MKTIFRFSLVLLLLITGSEILSANTKRKGREITGTHEDIVTKSECNTNDGSGSGMAPGIGEAIGDGSGGAVPIIEMALPFGIPFQYTDMSPSGGGPDGGGGAPAEPAKLVYTFELNDEIGPPSWRQTQAAFRQAREMNAACVLIRMNTFGGALDAADNIRQHILDFDRPVMVWVDRNAASAGALISIACDSIYMSRGASIGAATVVDANGKPAPEKYQSYMRSLLRTTAEANGRNPRIAEAMNDPRIRIEGINDSGRVLSFTTAEAIANKYCEAEGNTMNSILQRAGYSEYKVVSYTPTVLDKIIDFLLLPLVSGLLIMLIIGGIWFELQTPGVGFPLVVAVSAAVLYFAPLYLEGLAQHWEILVFIAGVILLIIELVAIPGFGVIGISGIVLMVTGLSLALTGTMPDGSSIALPDWGAFIKVALIVLMLVLTTLFGSIWVGERFFGSKMFGRIILRNEQQSDEGYESTGMKAQATTLTGKTGVAETILRPAGKVSIDGEMYDATAETGYIESGDAVQVVNIGVAQLVVRRVA
ncbi:MAG: nodulation protein NfeD [Bacteroidia bacterium]|jgi:membrane-bound serine protease (ClpP class)|nr:nodulation protein NfeD [Bacteroidia bacterium]